MRVWRKVLEVNFFAVVAVSKAMLPLLKCSPNSRIVNVSSLAGIIGMPGMGPYCASKHAMEGMSKCVREELSHWSIHLSNINPGFMRTPLLASGSSAGKLSFEAAPRAITSEYGTEWMEGQLETVNQISEDPALVVDAIVDALTDSHPPQWYFPGNAAKVMRLAPTFSSGLWDFLQSFNGPSVAKPTPEAVQKYR
jgi:NAD(P)-dependent dehydrogenase (short-subunit alcohol dehydrogenase family)